MEKQTRFQTVLLVILCCLTCFITLLPFFKVGFTCADDIEFYLSCLQGNFAEKASSYAHSQGRFAYSVTMPFYYCAYLFDNFLFDKFLYFACLLFSFFSFSHLVAKLTKSTAFASATALFLLAACPITINSHLPFIAYPCYFAFSFGLFCLGCCLVVKYHESNKYKYLILASIILFIAVLFYEAYLVFLLIVAVVMALHSFVKIGVVKSFKSVTFYKELLPVCVCGLLYFFIYVVFRQTCHNTYAGTMITDDFHWQNFFSVIWKCTKGVFPLQNFHQSDVVLVENSLLYGGHYKTFLFALTHAHPMAYVNAVIQLLLLYWLVKNMKNRVPVVTMGKIILVAVVVAFSSHLLIALTPKYHNDWYAWMQGYVTSFFSYFAIILVLAAIAYLFLKINYKSKALFRSACVLVGLLFCSMSVINQYTNENVSRTWQLLHQRFVVMDEMYKEGAFDVIDSTAVVYAEDLYREEAVGDIFSGTHSWAEVMKYKYNTDVRMCHSSEALRDCLALDNTRRIYYLQLKDNLCHNELLFSLAPIRRETIDFSLPNPMQNALCDSATLYYYSPAKHFAIILNSQCDSSFTNAVIANNDKNDTIALQYGINILPYRYIYWNYSNTPLTICSIKSPMMKASDFGITNLIRRNEERELNPYWWNEKMDN